jgi:aminoglycoside phosphotransferase (APT) family kinase protein
MPVVAESTHVLTFTRDRVVKQYRSWGCGEPDREWAGLAVLHQHARGLSPQPLRRRVEHGAPVIEMTRVAGEPLGATPLSHDQVEAVAGALAQMYQAVPGETLTSLPERRRGPGELRSLTWRWAQQVPQETCPPAAEAVRAAWAWLSSGDSGIVPAERVFTHADGNLANFIWDGQRCRIVDFEDSGVSDPAYEIADLLEHPSVRLAGLIGAGDLIEALGLPEAQRSRLREFRRLMAVYWLLMLLPGRPGHQRNPPGSLKRQAVHVTGML